MKRRPWSFTPRTRLGWWAVALAIAMPILFVIGSSFAASLYESVPGGQDLLEDIAARPALALTMLAGMGAGISAFIAGLMSLIRHKDYAILVIAATLIGALPVLYLVGEVAFPQ